MKAPIQQHIEIFHADDDTFIQLMELSEIPMTSETARLNDYLESLTYEIDYNLLNLLKAEGFLSDTYTRTFEQRLSMCGKKVVYDKILRGNWAAIEGPRVVVLDDGTVMKEARNRDEESSKFSDGRYHTGYDLVHCYTDVNKLEGELHVSIWCATCQKGYDVWSDTVVLDGDKCVECGSDDTVLTSIDDKGSVSCCREISPYR